MANNLNTISASSLTNHGVLVGAGSGVALTSLGVGTTGQVLIAATGADPAWGALVANPTESCAFMSVQNADQNNVTGDGTVYTILFNNEVYDVGNNFDAVSTFTAPNTGKYLFGMAIMPSQITTAMTGIFSLVTTAATYRFAQINYAGGDINAGSGGTSTVGWPAMLVNMTSGDTATVTYQASSGTKVVDLLGATSQGFRSCVFWGHQVA